MVSHAIAFLWRLVLWRRRAAAGADTRDPEPELAAETSASTPDSAIFSSTSRTGIRSQSAKFHFIHRPSCVSGSACLETGAREELVSVLGPRAA